MTKPLTQPPGLLMTAPPESKGARYSLLVARDSEEVVAAQRLRHLVFAEELGATLHSPQPGLDIDPFDEHCDHIVVRDDGSGEIVGCYRMLPPERASTLYSEGEFDLTALAPLRASLVETGRSCVHPDHRSGAVMSLMWAGIGRYMLLTGHRYLAGCASVPLSDGGSLARGVWDIVSARHLGPDHLRVRPLLPWDHRRAGPPGRAVLPALLRGYLRLGAWVCGEPALDPDFGCADLFVLLSLDRVDPRYLRFFVGQAA